MIKIKGRKRETAEHVLNLPDPERQILRRGREDRFVLATERHLGEIAAVELRFDCVGTSPSWFVDLIPLGLNATMSVTGFVKILKFTTYNWSDVGFLR